MKRQKTLFDFISSKKQKITSEENSQEDDQEECLTSDNTNLNVAQENNDNEPAISISSDRWPEIWTEKQKDEFTNKYPWLNYADGKIGNKVSI